MTETVHTIDLKFQGVRQVIASYVVEHDGGIALVDPGPYTCRRALDDGLAALGKSLRDVTDLLITHVHFDHAGAAWYVAAESDCRVHVHPLGVRHLASPERLWASAARIYSEPGMALLWGEMNAIDESRLHSTEHGEALASEHITATAWHSPGHAKHHVAYRLGDALFCGDVGGVRIGSGPVEPPCPPPDIDVERWRESIELLRGFGDEVKLFPTHFGKVEVHPEDHWTTLRAELDHWARLVGDRREDGTAARDALETYVEEKRKAANAEETYALANPVEMSTPGLLRYWSKRDGLQGERGERS